MCRSPDIYSLITIKTTSRCNRWVKKRTLVMGRKQENPRTGERFRLAEYLNKNLRLLSGKTNDEISQFCGYTTPNIVSMWITGKTKVPLERLPDLAELMGVNITFLLPLWVEQYGGKDMYSDILKALTRAVSEDELVWVEAMREVTQGKKIKKITATQKKEIAKVLGV